MPNNNFFVESLDPTALSFGEKFFAGGARAAESDENFFATDLLCEGPIEGLVDNNGNLLKYVFTENTSDIILSKGVFLNEVPILDTKLNKFNFSSVAFKILYGESANPNSKEQPSTVFRYSKNLYLNNGDFNVVSFGNGFFCFRADANGCSPMLVGGDNAGFENQINLNDLNSYKSKIEEAKLNCNPFSHKIRNKYCNYLKVQMRIDSLFFVGDRGYSWDSMQFVVELTEDNSDNIFYCICSLSILTRGDYLFEIPLKLNLNSKNKNSYYVKVYPLTQKVSPTITNRSKAFSISSIVECINGKGFFSYPYAVIAKSSVSSRHFGEDPSRTFDLKLLKIKVPNNYDSEAREYSGNWNGKFDSFLRWTDNPAWIFYDICTNQRYGVGNHSIIEKDINKWELYKISKYCDDLIKTNYPHKYKEDFFALDSANTNYIYINKISGSTSRSIEDIKQIYPPILDGEGYPQKNGGLQNSIIYLYDLKDSDGNYINQNHKKIIWKVESGSFNENDDFIASTDNFEVFRITLINDFGPRKAFERSIIGEPMMEEFSGQINFNDNEIIDTDTLNTAIRISSINTESGAKNFILNYYKNNSSTSQNSPQAVAVKNIIEEPVLPQEYYSKGVVGKCKSRVLNYRDPLETRFSLNVLIDNETECLKLLNDLASVFRGLVYYKNNSITTTIDVNKPVSYFFNNTNVKDGLFSYSSGTIDGTYTVVKVLYKDRFEGFNEEVEIVEDTELIRQYGIVIKEILGFGVTSRAQARAIGEWTLATNKFENQSVSFTTDLQGLILNPGDIIKIEDNYKNFSTLQGRVLSVNYDLGYVIVDRKLNLNLTGQKISFLSSDENLELSQINNSSQISQLNLDKLIELKIDRIENNTGKVYLADDYNFNLFNKIISSTPFIIRDIGINQEENLYKIVSIIEQEANEYSIFCIKHDTNKYDKLESGTIKNESSLNEKAISFSNFTSLKEVDISGLSDYYKAFSISLGDISSISFDFSFAEENSSLFLNSLDNYSYIELYFSEIYDYIADQALNGSTEDARLYYQKTKDVFDDGGGFLCKVYYKNSSIKFLVNASSISNKRIFLGLSINNLNPVSSSSGIRIYLFNKENKFITV